MNTLLCPLTSALAAVLVLSTAAPAAPIAVINASFEDPPLAAGTWSNTLPGWSDAGTDASKRFVERIAGFNGGGNNHLAMEQGWQVWQDVPSAIYQPFTIYALRAAVGNRAGNTVAGNISRIVLTNTAETAASGDDFNAFTGTAAGTFGQLLHRMSTGASGGRIGTPLRVKLEAPGTGRTHFDNIRLTSCGTFTGGDAGEGLDLQGDFAYAVNLGTNGAPGQIGDAVFTADTAPGVTLSGAANVIDNWSAPAYGATTNDDRLEQAMRSIRHPGSNPSAMTVTLANLQAGRGYKLQLLFVEECCDRAFDVKVNDAIVFDDFRLQDFGVAGVPLVISHSFVATGTTATIELDGTSVADPNLDRSPTLSAFTLERSFVVSTTANSGAGSLRQALADAAARAGADIIGFDPAVFNGEAADTITLASELTVSDAAGVTIDASANTGGVTVSGSNLVRGFNITGTGNLTLRGLTITKGKAVAGDGGGLLVGSTGVLLMEGCTVQGNAAANSGGGLGSSGQATVVNCTFLENSASFGGAIISAPGAGLTLRHCTLTGNAGTPCCGGLVSRGSTMLESCIVAGNTGTAGADINFEGGTLTRRGINLIGNNTSLTTQFPAGLPNANGDFAGTAAAPFPAMLGPLADNGGPVKTMMPLPNSPALDRVASSTLTTDQRGLPRVMWGKADIGAVEAGISSNCGWEVREFFRTPATALATLADAEALVADVNATTVTGTQQTINFSDASASGAGFFNGNVPFISSTAKDDFVTVARTFINISEEDDYTFGFSSDEGARLRIFGANFISSTRLNTANPANPAHSGDTLSFPGLTGNADTLGVCHLLPGVYPVEFLTWERVGGTYAEVFAARGAKTAVDGAFRLLGDTGGGHPGLIVPNSQLRNESFTTGNGGYTVVDTNGPLQGPWTYNAAAGTWSSAGQNAELGRAPSTALTSPAITMTVAGEARVQFTHRYSFEADSTNWDGGQLQMSLNGGAFTAVPQTAFTANGYNGTVVSTGASALHGQPAFVAASAGYATPAFITSSASLGFLAAGDFVQLRFLAAFDTNTSPGPAWEITSLTVEQSSAWEVTVIRNGANSLAAAVSQMATYWCNPPQVTAPRFTGVFGTINFTDPQAGGGGHGQPQVPFPGDTAANDDNFALGARTMITVPEDGDYTFCILGDDFVRFRIPGSRGWTVAGGASPVPLVDGFLTNGCCADVFGQVFLYAGTHEVELIFTDTGGNSFLGLWVAPGRLASFDAQTARNFLPVGTNASGDTNAAVAPGTQPGAVVRPSNDDFANAIVLTGAAASGSGCNEGGTLETGEPATSHLGKSVWWTWTAPSAGPVQVDTMGSDFDTVLSVHTGATLAALTLTGTNDDGGPDGTSTLVFTATAGTVYRIRVGGYDGETGTIRIQAGGFVPPANDTFAAPAVLGNPASLSVTGSNASATIQAGEPGPGDTVARSVWFSWTAPATGNYIMDTTGSEFDTVLAVYSGTVLNALTELASDDDSGASGHNESRLVLFATAGVTYRIAIYGYGDDDYGRYYLTIIPVPVITAYSLRNGPGGARIFNLRWRSEPGVNYQVESSSDLTTWTSVALCTASEGTETDLDIESIPVAATRLYFRVARE